MPARDITHVPRGTAAINAYGTEGLDLATILAAGITATENANDAWHREEENPRGYHWHASQLGGCPRDAVLRRAGLSLDGMTLTGALTFQIGHLYHELFEKGAEIYAAGEENFEILAMETGGYHPDMPLAARCDILFRWKGRVILGDFKTESPFAKQKRTVEAQAKGFSDAFKWEHRVQLAATAMVLEKQGDLDIDQITEGRLIYIDKSAGSIDQVVCPIEYSDRLVVRQLVGDLEGYWSHYERDGTLPPALRAADDIWRCQARSSTDPKGKWCPSRTTCFARQAQAQ